MLDERQLTNAEWDTWQDVVAAWRAEIGEINEARFNPVVKAIRRWGEYLATLRRGQGEGLVRDARDHANEAFSHTP